MINFDILLNRFLFSNNQDTDLTRSNINKSSKSQVNLPSWCVLDAPGLLNMILINLPQKLEDVGSYAD